MLKGIKFIAVAIHTHKFVNKWQIQYILLNEKKTFIPSNITLLVHNFVDYLITSHHQANFYKKCKNINMTLYYVSQNRREITPLTNLFTV